MGCSGIFLILSWWFIETSTWYAADASEFMASTESPVYLSVNKGDKVFIPCFNTNSSQQEFYIWGIHDGLYPLGNLPKWVEATLKGLVIPFTLTKHKGVYKCYKTESELNELILLSTVVLKVMEYPILETGESKSSSIYEEELNLRVSLPTAVVFIPCIPACGTNKTILWEIDGLLYPSLALPNNHVTFHHGIIVNTSFFTNRVVNKTYTCYHYDTTRMIEELFKVVLTQSFGSQLDLTHEGDTNTLPARLSFVSRLTSFTSDLKVFGFRFVDDATQCGESENVLVILTEALDLKRKEIIWESSSHLSQGPTIAIPSSVLNDDDDNVYMTITAKNESGVVCASLSHYFRVEASEVTTAKCTQEGDSSCIDLPTDLRGIAALWPSKPGSDIDCACPVFDSGPNGPGFDNCYCFALNLTTYTVEKVGSRLCWKNLTRHANDTKILIVRDSFSDAFQLILRMVESHTQISVQGPDPYPPKITIMKNTSICFESQSTEWSPVLATNVIMYDVTGDTVKNCIMDSSNFCLYFGDFPQICAPFEFKAEALTGCTESPYSFAFTASSGRITTCDCLHIKVNLTMDVTDTMSDSFLVNVNINCLYKTGYDINQISNLYLEAIPVSGCSSRKCNNESIIFNVSCGQTSKEVHLSQLISSTNYLLMLSWKGHNESTTCLIQTKLATTANQDENAAVAVILSFVSFISIITALLVVVGMRIYCRHRRNQYRTITRPKYSEESVTTEL